MPVVTKYRKAATRGSSKAVVVDGCRTAFVKSFGVFEDATTLDLYCHVIDGLVRKMGIDPEELDEISAGVVVPQPKNPNVARDALLNLNLPAHIHGYTINRACTSSLQTVTDAVRSIQTGNPHMILAGGVEVLSDVPIVYSKDARKFLVKFSKAKSAAAKLSMLGKFSAKAWLPKPPSLSEPLTGLTMGQHAEIMAKKNSVSRAAQDEFALLSHQRAAAAQAKGYFDEEIVQVWPAPKYAKCIKTDNVIRTDGTIEKLAELRPAFDKLYGTITAGNSSPLTDGAAITLVGDEERSKALGFKPKARIKDMCYVGVDPRDQLLIGPAIAIPLLLKKNGLTLQDIDLFEIHEAFAAQVLSCLYSMESKTFCKDVFGDASAFGSIPSDKLNVNGGAIAIGHPFGATGSRLVNTLSNELIRRNKQLGVIAICAAGGMAGAMLIERI